MEVKTSCMHYKVRILYNQTITPYMYTQYYIMDTKYIVQEMPDEDLTFLLPPEKMKVELIRYFY